RVPEVRLIGEDGSQVGVVPTEQALEYAQERDLDLVEVAAEARPPVVRVLDYSKYKYEQEQKAKAARRHQKQVNVREIKLRPKIATKDYETKKGHVPDVDRLSSSSLAPRADEQVKRPRLVEAHAAVGPLRPVLVDSLDEHE